jgi:hypothetical protein
MNMKNLINIVAISFAVFLFSTGTSFAQESPLQHPANYKTHPAGKRTVVKSETNSVSTETVEATNYKRPQQKTKVKRASLETSTSPKRNYKMKNTTV